MRHTSFTLIELLIVVAIIVILAAIAVPSFFNARTRALLARVYGDHYAYANACEQYRIDHNTYPWPLIEARGYGAFTPFVLFELTTPTPYLNSADGVDPFNTTRNWKGRLTSREAEDPWYTYTFYRGHFTLKPVSGLYPEKPNGFVVVSFGPDRIGSGGMIWPLDCKVYGVDVANDYIFHVSNGLQSSGDIVRYGGEVNAPVIFEQ